MPGALGMIFTLLASLALPVLALVLFIVRPKWRVFMKPCLIGMATFLIFQVFTRLPILQLVLPGQTWYVLFQMAHPVLTIVLVSLSAGVFEECGRFVMMRILRPSERTVAAAIAFGIGHGGMEAILIAALPNLLGWAQNPFAVAAMPFLDVAIVGVERLLAIMLHVGLSVLVMEALRSSKNLLLRWWLLPIAIVIHGAANSAAVLTGQMTGSGWMSEAAFLPFAAAMLILTIVMYKRGKKEVFT